jgi:hypothetical protein
MKISAAVSDSTPIVLIYGAEGRGKTTLAAKFPKHCLASAFAHLGRDAEAREAAARLLKVDPAFTSSKAQRASRSASASAPARARRCRWRALCP